MHCLHWKWKKANVTFHVKTLTAIGVSLLYYFKRMCMKAKVCPRWVIIWVSTEEEPPSRYSFFVGRYLTLGSHKLSKVTLLVLTIYNGQLSSTCNQLRQKFFFLISAENKQGTIIQNVLNKSSKGTHSFRTDNWVLFQTSSNQKNLQR